MNGISGERCQRVAVLLLPNAHWILPGAKARGIPSAPPAIRGPPTEHGDYSRAGMGGENFRATQDGVIKVGRDDRQGCAVLSDRLDSEPGAPRF